MPSLAIIWFFLLLLLGSSGWSHAFRHQGHHPDSIAELNDSAAAQKVYIWGLDLSGSLRGAGGVGGLVAVDSKVSPAEVSFVSYDGNGNVTGLTKATDGTTSAEYAYGPFGELLRKPHPGSTYASVNPFLFSTKYWDVESDFLYYGYRFYDPNRGRWLSRDPIGERGGMNLYGLAENNPISNIDVLGLRVPRNDDEIIDHLSGYLSLELEWLKLMGLDISGNSNSRELRRMERLMELMNRELEIALTFRNTQCDSAYINLSYPEQGFEQAVDLYGPLPPLGGRPLTALENDFLTSDKYWRNGGFNPAAGLGLSDQSAVLLDMATLPSVIRSGTRAVYELSKNCAAKGAQSLNPASLRFSQSSVNGVEEIAASMRQNGWQGGPIDVVKMSDGSLTTFDNTRVLAAQKAGIEVQAIVREGCEAFPAGRWTPRNGIQPATWEQAIQLRIQQQNRIFRQTYPNGSPFTGSVE